MLSTYYPQFVDHPSKILIFIPRVWYASHVSGRASAIRAIQDWKPVGEVSDLVARNAARSAEAEDVKMAPYFIAAQLYWGINHIR